MQSSLTSGTRSGASFSANEIEMNFLEDDADINFADEGARKHLEESVASLPDNMDQALEHPDFGPATLLEISLVKDMKTYHLVDPKTVPKRTPIH